MPWYKYWLLILFLFGVSHLLYSQEKSCTLTITVVDSVTRVPLPNASASFQTNTPSEMTWAYTDAQGQVSYTPPTGDTVRGSFSYLGYAEKTIALWCANEASIERVVLLAANDLPLREVVITEQLPADVVDRIEILYKYNDIGMLQGQDSGDRLALNVRLKQDKQKFIFGEVKASTNATKRHQLNPSLFY